MATSTKKDKYEQIIDDVPFTLDVNVPHQLACCDCGLVHKIRFNVDHANDAPVVILTYLRDEKATKKNRKKNFQGLVLSPQEDKE